MRENRFLVWIVLGVVFFIVLNLPLPLLQRAKMSLRESVAPFQRTLLGFAHRGSSLFSSLRRAGVPAEEQEKMVAELTRLRNEVEHLKTLADENAELREQLRFVDRFDRQLIPCEVIARGDISSWWQTIRLGKGSIDGVAPKSAVITPEGLIGKTTDVSRHTADVLLIVDPNSKAAARIPRVDGFGVVGGAGVSLKGEGTCRMEFVDRNADIRPGDKVVTSGLGGVYPSGLLVGYVEDIHLDQSGLYKYADVIPAADMAALRYVFVILEKEQAE